MSNKIASIRGTHDVLPSDLPLWYFIEDNMRAVCDAYGYREIRLPVFEYTELFSRGVGDTTDVVQKEMYTFDDKGGRSITLRPEGTAGAMRSFLQHSLGQHTPVKLYYFTTCYRYEKPAAGRLREYYTFGVEHVCAKDASADAEVAAAGVDFINRCGIKGMTLHLGSIGCPTCRAEYNVKLRAYLEPKAEQLCNTCRDRLTRNPMRILDCKSPQCQGIVADAPRILYHQCEACNAHYANTKRYLDAIGIAYVEDDGLVRGLDYYSTTVFEFVKRIGDSDVVLGGGGRYDYLVETLGGDPTPSCGFGIGIERIAMAIEHDGVTVHPSPAPAYYVIGIGDEGNDAAFKLAQKLRDGGTYVEYDTMRRSVKAQMKQADRLRAQRVVVIGEDELASGVAKVRDMQTREETTMRLDS